jgi:hypothetical protein
MQNLKRRTLVKITGIALGGAALGLIGGPVYGTLTKAKRDEESEVVRKELLHTNPQYQELVRQEETLDVATNAIKKQKKEIAKAERQLVEGKLSDPAEYDKNVTRATWVTIIGAVSLGIAMTATAVVWTRDRRNEAAEVYIRGERFIVTSKE